MGINALIQGGAGTTDASIEKFFAPLRELKALRPRIQGAGQRERLDYWLNFIRASELRVRTWVLSGRLAVKMGELNNIPEADKKQDFARTAVLPLRLAVARNYEDMIAAFVRCAKSPGEIGTIASIESGNRGRIVTAHDAILEKLLGQTLPAETAVSTAYRGAPRLVVSATCTQVRASEPSEVRAFVLSSSKCTGVMLYYRPLGEGAFKQAAATHRARQAYRVALPAPSAGTVEYYLEATLDDGQKIHWPTTAPAINQTVVVW